MNTTLRTVLAVFLIGLITLCATLSGSKLVGRARVDLTENQLYTLSDGTRSILGKLNQPIHLKLYFSRVAAMKGPEMIRFWNNYYLFVRDLLEEYANVAGGKVKLEIIDPRPYSDEEEEAIQQGIKRFPLPGDEGFFFGLVAETQLGKKASIPFFEPDRQVFVEYDVSKLINQVVRREKKKIGVLSSLPVAGTDMSPYMMQMMRMQGQKPQKPWILIDHLKEEYEVTEVDKAAEAIAEDIDFLMVVHPKELSEKTLFAIDQYVMRGGRLLIFVDPHCMQDKPEQNPQNPYAGMMAHKGSSDLNRLLRRWGVEMAENEIAVDRALAVSANLRPNQNPQPFLPFLDLTAECTNDEEVISSDLEGLRFLYAGVLRRVEVEGTRLVPLLQTTSIGSTWVPSGPFELNMPDAATVRKAVTDGTEPVTLAALVTGKLKTAFPGGAPEEPEDDGADDAADEKASPAPEADAEDADEAEEAPPALAESVDDAMVLVVADVDCLSDMLCYQESFFGTAQTSQNPNFIFNAVDYLAGTGDLIAIRSRGRYSRPFDVVDRIELEADEATEDEKARIQAEIDSFNQELSKLSSSLNEKNATLIKSSALAKQQELKEKIRKANKALRDLQAGKREKVEALGASLELVNTVVAPAVILLVAIVLAVLRTMQAKRYAARRAQQ